MFPLHLFWGVAKWEVKDVKTIWQRYVYIYSDFCWAAISYTVIDIHRDIHILYSFLFVFIYIRILFFFFLFCRRKKGSKNVCSSIWSSSPFFLSRSFPVSMWKCDKKQKKDIVLSSPPFVSLLLLLLKKRGERRREKSVERYVMQCVWRGFGCSHCPNSFLLLFNSVLNNDDDDVINESFKRNLLV